MTLLSDFNKRSLNRNFRRQVLGPVVLMAFAIVALLPGDSGNAVAAPVVGVTSAVKGLAFVSTNGAQRKARVRDSILLNDEVRTKDDSALQILLVDRTVFTVGQNCSLVVDEFIYDPSTSEGSLSAKVITGAFRYMSGRIGRSNPGNAILTTPSATVGIRGTFLEGIVGADAVALAQLGGIDTSSASTAEASIIILRGAGRRANTIDDPGALTITSGGISKSIFKPGFAIFSPGPGLPPVGPFPMTDEMLDYLDFFLRSTPNGPGENPLNVVSTGSQESGQHQFENQQSGADPNLEDGFDAGIEDSLLDLIEDDKEPPCCID